MIFNDFLKMQIIKACALRSKIQILILLILYLDMQKYQKSDKSFRECHF